MQPSQPVPPPQPTTPSPPDRAPQPSGGRRSLSTSRERAIHHLPDERNLWPLALGALGVVFGDIGTSPLYAMRECFHGPHGIAPTPPHVLGVLSLIFWSLIVIISVKYCWLVMRADNDGEGGVLALMALVCPSPRERGGPGAPPSPGESGRHDASSDGSRAERRRRRVLITLGLFGAALLYGDGAITPAISVLSAVEGLEVATPRFAPYVIPFTIGILVALFLIQRYGTGRVGTLFGPVMVVWFLALAALGIVSAAGAPETLAALNPYYAVAFLRETGFAAFRVLGGVFLVVTGGEALYADMGHFGRRPIRFAWFTLVLPALMLNYLGQGALLLSDPAAATNPFYLLAPSFALYPLVGLATAASVIASQALISGAFSLTRQAIQLGYLPRMEIRHTSAEEMGQIYIPRVNAALSLLTVALVLGFRSSAGLAGAYGIAVAVTMVITVILAFEAMRRVWRWPLVAGLAVAALLLGVDATFLAANSLKIVHGGWFPLLNGLAGFTLMATWWKGREILAVRLRETTPPIEDFVREIELRRPLRVPGTAVYMTSNPAGTPPALVQNVEHNKVLHEQVILLTVETAKSPYVPAARSLRMEKLGEGFFRVVSRFGFMEDPSVPAVVEQCKTAGVRLEVDEATFVLGRETILATDRPGMAIWREHLFALMALNAQRAAAFFEIPSERVLEIGTQIDL